MAMKRVLIVNKTFPAAGLELLKGKVEYTVVPHVDHDPESLPTIKKELKGVDAIIWNTKHRLTGPLLDLAGPNLKCVSTMSSGIDQVEEAEIKRRNLPLGNTPQVLDDAVADIAVGLLIAAARRFKESVAELESGEWKYGVQWMIGQDITGSTVGIVGLGGIGQAVVRRLRGFDVKTFLYSGRSDKPEAKSLGAERVPVEQLLKESDYVVLCCPLTEETRHLINEQTLGIMKKNAVLVNIARGGIVDQPALYKALKENRIFAAGLDVVTPEPLPKDDPLVSLSLRLAILHLMATLSNQLPLTTSTFHYLWLTFTLLALFGFVSQTNCAEVAAMTKNLKVLVSSNDYPEAGLKILREHFTVLQSRFNHFGEEGITQNKEELLKLAPGISALVWVSHHPITKELLDVAGPSLKVVATASAGYNHCNLDELMARGIKLSNTPDVLSAAVAEVAIALMLGAGRRFTENLEQVHSGKWDIGFQKVLGQEIRGSTVGVVGLGGIGRAAVKRLAGFEVAKFLYSGHREKPEGKALGAEFVSQNELVAQSDFLILAVPLTNETKHMVNAELLGKMKSNAILINVGRGDLVDQDALYDALKNRVIYAAGIDVTTPEPLPRDHKLLTLPNLFVLPHIGSATVRTRNDMAELAANNLVNALSGKPLITPVLP